MQQKFNRRAQDASQQFSVKTSQTEIVGGLKLKAAAVYLGGSSVPNMHRLIARGLLKPNRCLRHLLFSIEELNRFLRQ